MKKVKQSRSHSQNSLSHFPVKFKLKDADLNQVSGGYISMYWHWKDSGAENRLVELGYKHLR